jgi:hypothetical protein
MTAQKLKTVFLKDWPTRLVLTVLTAFAGFVWAQGKEIVRHRVVEAVQPSLDTIAKRQDTTDQRVAAVQGEAAKLNDKLDALISILVDSSPQVKKAAQDRIQKNKDSQDVKDALAGGSR